MDGKSSSPKPRLKYQWTQSALSAMDEASRKSQAYRPSLEELSIMPVRSIHQQIESQSEHHADVNSPDHYTVGGHEAIAVIKAKLTPEEYRGYLKGNGLKYMMRANYKGQHDKDCAKAQWYIDELNKVLSDGQ